MPVYTHSSVCPACGATCSAEWHGDPDAPSLAVLRKIRARQGVVTADDFGTKAARDLAGAYRADRGRCRYCPRKPLSAELRAQLFEAIVGEAPESPYWPGA